MLNRITEVALFFHAVIRRSEQLLRIEQLLITGRSYEQVCIALRFKLPKTVRKLAYRCCYGAFSLITNNLKINNI